MNMKSNKNSKWKDNSFQMRPRTELFPIHCHDWNIHCCCTRFAKSHLLSGVAIPCRRIVVVSIQITQAIGPAFRSWRLNIPMSCAGQTKNEKHYAGHAIQFSITKQKFMERQ